MNRSNVMSLADRDGLIWMDGEMVPWREAKVHVLTHTFHYGLGVFEGVRAYKTKDQGTCIFRLQEHTDRLFNSAHILRMAMPFDKETLIQAQKDVVRLNGLEEGYLRPMCFYGAEGMGLRADKLETHVMIAAWEWPSYMDPEARDRGIKVRTSSFTRHHVNIRLSGTAATNVDGYGITKWHKWAMAWTLGGTDGAQVNASELAKTLYGVDLIDNETIKSPARVWL
jgi:branched-chain amino acid aminotransferase